MAEYKPIYKKMWVAAEQLGEKTLWIESFGENCRCARAIEKVIRENYHDNVLGDGTAEVLAEFGPGRVSWVLANTLAAHYGDGRFSRENLLWVREIRLPDDAESRRFCVNAHPGLTNLFIEQIKRAGQLVSPDVLNAEDETETESLEPQMGGM